MGTPPRNPDAPTAVRYNVVVFLAGMTFILYLDRVCISQAAATIQDELDISNTRMGIVFAAFTLPYALFQMPAGRLADRFGSRAILTGIVLAWSLFTILTGTATGFWAILLIRFLFGIAESGALPNAFRVLSQWFPESGRGTAQGLVVTAMNLGGAVAPVAAAILIGRFGWRWTFAAFGCLGLAWAAGFARWFRESPAEHPGVNPAERRLIGAGRPAPTGPPPPIPWRLVAASRNVWLLGILMNCSAGVYYAIFSWYPSYLQKGRGLSPEEAGGLASLALAGGVGGGITGGLVTDWLLRRTGSPVAARCRVGSIACLVGGVALFLGVRADDPVVAATWTAVTMLCLQFQLPGWWATATGISGRHVGALVGLMNSLGVVGAVAAQSLLGVLADRPGDPTTTLRDRWDPGLYACAVALLLAAITWVFVRPTRVVEPDPSDD